MSSARTFAGSLPGANATAKTASAPGRSSRSCRFAAMRSRTWLAPNGKITCETRKRTGTSGGSASVPRSGVCDTARMASGLADMDPPVPPTLRAGGPPTGPSSPGRRLVARAAGRVAVLGVRSGPVGAERDARASAPPDRGGEGIRLVAGLRQRHVRHLGPQVDAARLQLLADALCIVAHFAVL